MALMCPDAAAALLEKDARFETAGPVLYNAEVLVSRPGVRAVSAGAALTLDRLSRTAPADWTRLDMGGGVRRQCYEIIERFVAFHLGLSWDGGRFRKV